MQPHTYTGVLLYDLLNSLGPQFDLSINNDKLRFYAAATGSDGYQAIVAWGEIDPQFENKGVLLAITEDAVVCLVCGGAFKHLTNTHLGRHGLTSDEYKRRFGYNNRRSLMAPDVRRLHAANAVRMGLADRIRVRPVVANVALRRQGGQRVRRLEEPLRRREIVPFKAAPPPRDDRGRFTRPAP